MHVNTYTHKCPHNDVSKKIMNAKFHNRYLTTEFSPAQMVRSQITNTDSRLHSYTCTYILAFTEA